MAGKIRTIAAFDIGGTSTRLRFVNQGGNLIGTPKKWCTPTINNSKLAPAQLPHELVARLTRSLLDIKPSPDAIGISFAGPVTVDGTVVKAPNIWGTSIDNVPLARRIQEATSLPTTVVNDMTAAAWREKIFGQAHDDSSFLIITVSSGVGSKLFTDGKVLLGAQGIAGEIGHFVIDPSSKIECGCGGYGHLESLASGIAAQRIAKEMAQRGNQTYNTSSLTYQLSNGRPDEITNEVLATAAKQNDPFALKVLEKITQPLAIGINHIWAMSAVKRVFIIGGFALGVGDSYLNVLRQQVSKVGLMGIRQDKIASFIDSLIVRGTDDDNSGVIGAAAAAIARDS